MRGKLRDKRTANKHDIVKREAIERSRSNKRDIRTMVWLNPEEDDDELDEEETSVESPQKK